MDRNTLIIYVWLAIITTIVIGYIAYSLFSKIKKSKHSLKPSEIKLKIVVPLITELELRWKPASKELENKEKEIRDKEKELEEVLLLLQKSIRQGDEIMEIAEKFVKLAKELSGLCGNFYWLYSNERKKREKYIEGITEELLEIFTDYKKIACVGCWKKFESLLKRRRRKNEDKRISSVKENE